MRGILAISKEQVILTLFIRIIDDVNDAKIFQRSALFH